MIHGVSVLVSALHHGDHANEANRQRKCIASSLALRVNSMSLISGQLQPKQKGLSKVHTKVMFVLIT